MDLARQLLFEIEGMEWEGCENLAFSFPDRDELEVFYHLELLAEAGLIIGERQDAMGTGPRMYPERLTWEGHEFLDEVRSDSTWHRVKGALIEKGAGVAFETLKIALAAYTDHVTKNIFSGGAS